MEKKMMMQSTKLSMKEFPESNQTPLRMNKMQYCSLEEDNDKKVAFIIKKYNLKARSVNADTQTDAKFFQGLVDNVRVFIIEEMEKMNHIQNTLRAEGSKALSPEINLFKHKEIRKRLG